MKKLFKSSAQAAAFVVMMSICAVQVFAAGMDGGFGGSSSGAPESYSAVVEYTETQTVSGETIESTGTDENAILVATDGIVVTLEDMTVSRVSSNSTGGDDASFYGVGASVLVTAGTLVMNDSTIYGNGAGAAGVFAYGDGVVYVSDTEIETVKDTSGGIHVAGGGTLYAWDLTVVTAGGSSAAIRSDRGGGTMVVDGGTYTSNGTGSPAIYSAGDITVNNAVLTATASEAICMEGRNAIRLYDCTLSGSMADDSQNDCTWNIILYQSQSGDAEEGNAYFEMVGGSITAENGGMFYTTNTESTYVISGVDITYASDSEFVIKCTGNSNSRGWGSTGSNGANCTFTAIDQELEGAVIWDSISTLDLYLTDGSTLTGYAVDDESNAGSGGSGYCNVVIDETSSWIVTADSTVTALSVSGTIADEDGNSVSIIGTDGTVYVSGTSAYTITVESYSETADVSGASEVHSFSEYAVDKLESSDDSEEDEDDGTTEDGSGDSGEDEDSGSTGDSGDEGTGEDENGGTTEDGSGDSGEDEDSGSTGDSGDEGTGEDENGGTTEDGSGDSGEDEDSGNTGDSSEDADSEETQATITRVSGQTRYETAELVAEESFSACTYAVIATGTNYPDALAAASLAGALDAPILLTSDATVSATIAELKELGVTNVYITGGTASVSQAVEDAIVAEGIMVERLAGETRQETALAIAAEVLRITGDAASNICFIAMGTNYPDALAVSAYAYYAQAPIYLADKDGSISDEVLAAIKAAGYSEIVILGGTSSVSEAAESVLSAISGVTVTRLGGETRYETAALIAEWEVSQGMSYDNAVIATGTNYPDALTAASLCGQNGSVLLLANSTATGSSVLESVLRENAADISNIYIVGGINSVSEEIYAMIEEALG